MITDKELNEISLSPTKKDYYQIWNEIIDLASKISDRWSPNSTNESDPGIVLLKSLVAIADKLNYNIDKNTLEAFMPSATQLESMRKLTEMMGYTMKYYRSATCKVNISYKDTNEKTLAQIGSIYFPKFVNLKNEEEDVNYVTLEDFTLQESEPSRQVVAIEGELIECETNTDNIISLMHLDDNHRYILPEANIAENAIFVYNITDVGGVSRESDPWKCVDNLNVQLPGTCVYKFGFDSAQNLPYIEFPEDISQLIKDGLRIKYIRTNGIGGNISARVLCKLEIPALWGTADEGSPIRDLIADDFSVSNVSAAMNGADPESITSAYNNYKKVIGTFDTLVTCRDYMNKIYQLTVSDTDTTPLISNIVVSDIRDDINKATTLCSFDEYGICYSDVSLKGNGTDLIDHFDLVLYPFKTIYGLNTYDEYTNSFKISNENVNKIKYDLNECKTISHNFVTPESDEIACIKNYLKLKANITTVKKVTTVEEKEILNNVYTSIYKNFNCRQIDFGEEIPYDTILEVIKNADTRIKDINLDEPILYTVIVDNHNNENELVATATGGIPSLEDDVASRCYNKLTLRNILAGRIAAFQYDEDFKTSYADMPYAPGVNAQGEVVSYEPKYPAENQKIIKMSSEFIVNAEEQNSTDGLTLNENEVIQFRMPNLKTTVTYPAYVNYFIKLNLPTDASKHAAVPATFISLNTYLSQQDSSSQIVGGSLKWDTFVNDNATSLSFTTVTGISDNQSLARKIETYGAIFIRNGNSYHHVDHYSEEYEHSEFFAVDPNQGNNFAKFDSYIKSQTYNGSQDKKLEGIFRTLGVDTSRTPGLYVDTDYVKYMPAYKSNILANLFVQKTHALNIPDPEDPSHIIPDPNIGVLYTENGLGEDANYPTIGKDAEYQLGDNDYLLINYTDSQTDSSGNEQKTVINKYWGPGTIIKPNFPIVDSELYHNNHNYSKKDNFYFEKQPNCPGLFTLSTDEQICIRDIVKVELDDDITYLYWERNDEPENATSSEFTFDEYYGKTSGDFNAYTLKEGEHLYYTNAKKTDLAYYGAGTLIVKSEDTPKLIKNNTLGTVSEEEIMTYGIAAAIPWGTAYRLSKNLGSGKERKLTLIENQYISLTEGDILYTISNSDNTNNNLFDLSLNNYWTEVKSATYRFAEDENGSTTTLPLVNIKGISWMVRSKLDFNMSPTNPQVLHKNDSITITLKNKSGSDTTSELKIEPLIQAIPNELDDSSDSDDPVLSVTPIAIYSNYQYNCGYSNIPVYIDDLKLKLVQVSNPIIGNDDQHTSAVNLDNYANGDATFTKFAFETVSPDLWDVSKPVFSVNTNILDNKFGLIMFYYIDELNGEIGHTNAYIEVETDGTPGAGLRVFNEVNEGYERQDMPVARGFVFNPGIQVLEFTPGVTKIHFYADSTIAEDTDNDSSDSSDSEGYVDYGKSYQSIIIFSDLDLVKDINPKLNYRFNAQAGDTNEGKALEQMLTDIRNTKIADTFYYNNPVSKSNAIELNNYIEDDTLASPAVWYDPNNANNKFVISEIDADYLPIGIALTRASKL